MINTVSKKDGIRANASGRRYGAKLLFQYRVEGHSARRRKCEVRIIQFRATSHRTALTKAKKTGRASELQYSNTSGAIVRLEFVGVMDIIDLEPFDSHEVWFEITNLLLPMERRHQCIPADRDLLDRI